MIRLFAFLVVFTALSACEDKWGDAMNYNVRNENPIDFVMPPDAPYIGQQFLPFAPNREFAAHLGVDFWGQRSRPVMAAAPGRVVRAFLDPAYGRRIMIDHGVRADGERYFTQYFHLKEIEVAVGDEVVRGQQIGMLGVSGFLAGFPHLHFEVLAGKNRRRALAVDPHLHWADGVGLVTCFDADATYDESRLSATVPIPCRDGAPL